MEGPLVPLLSTHADRQGVNMLVTVCLFVRLRISPQRIKLAASNFARRLVDVQGRESPIFVNFAPPKAQNRTNWPARHHLHGVHIHYPFGFQIHDRVPCGRRIGMCGYTSVPEDRHLTPIAIEPSIGVDILLS